MRYVICGDRFSKRQKDAHRKQDLYVYELRSGDNGEITIERNVLVNHIGSILTEEKLKFDKYGIIDFEEFQKNNELYAEWNKF